MTPWTVYSLVCGMNDSKDLVTERRGYDNTVTVQDDPSVTLSESRYVQNAAISSFAARRSSESPLE